MPGKTSHPTLEKAELYDLRRDQGERYNVYDLYPEVVKELTAIADKYREDLGDDLTGNEGKNRRLPGFRADYE